MQTIFIELPAFERHREDYLDDEGLTQLQIALMTNPTAGDVIEGSGDLNSELIMRGKP